MSTTTPERYDVLAAMKPRELAAEISALLTKKQDTTGLYDQVIEAMTRRAGGDAEQGIEDGTLLWAAALVAGGNAHPSTVKS